jgi:S1-C subfamily serine protease
MSGVTYRSRSRRPVLAAALLVALAAIATVVAIALLGSESHRPAAVKPVRVTSDTGIATGFAIADDRVVTVAHAVAGSRAVGVEVDAGSGPMPARVLAVDRRSDLALLAARDAGGSRLDVATAREGTDLRLVRLRDGRGSWVSVHVRRAIVAHLRAPGASRSVRRPALELDARVRAGDSGAPLVTESGALAGIVFATSRGRAATAYAVDAAALGRLLSR